MARKNQQLEKCFSVLSVIVLIAAWFLGGLRVNDSEAEFFRLVTRGGGEVSEISPRLYQVQFPGQSAPKWVSFGSGTGYGGDVVIGGVFTDEGQLETLALLSGKETASYLEKVIENKLPDSLLGADIRQPLSADGVTGATLTSNAWVAAIEQAAEVVRVARFDLQFAKQGSAWQYFKWLDVAALVFFVAAILVNRSRSKHKNRFNVALLTASTLVFGFHSASLYSTTTMGGLIQGAWLQGVASYTPFILLALSLGYILYYNRNIYCQSLCPFGAAQQCLAKLGNAKATPLRQQVFVWFPRVLLLVTLCLGLYFRQPAAFGYEPFGIAFGMIGGMYLFILTVTIILTSLVIRRPWCQSLCPVNAMTDFVVFNKNWIKQMRKKRSKKRSEVRRCENT